MLPSRRPLQQLLTSSPKSSLDAASCSVFTEHFSSNRDPILKRENLPKLRKSYFFPLYKALALSSRRGKFISMKLIMKNVVFCFLCQNPPRCLNSILWGKENHLQFTYAQIPWERLHAAHSPGGEQSTERVKNPNQNPRNSK